MSLEKELKKKEEAKKAATEKGTKGTKLEEVTKALTKTTKKTLEEHGERISLLEEAIRVNNESLQAVVGYNKILGFAIFGDDYMAKMAEVAEKMSQSAPQNEPDPAPQPEPEPASTAEQEPEPAPQPEPEPAPQPAPASQPAPQPAPEPAPAPAPQNKQRLSWGYAYKYWDIDSQSYKITFNLWEAKEMDPEYIPVPYLKVNGDFLRLATWGEMGKLFPQAK